ncbi:hypothetical protein CANARDRAFT_117800 [[Candida] arabinofermentans NRRL YB-2248]|uniref:Ribosomal RNA-processing protein 40 n=1 Tax=[Candida] arabinofermentans NRRL YB-2248 TaxID=983967 RepID=A0A1E4T4X9_9ASCO|nr:hypothetical protein CANARDRAFT_117800 [[Candida] arabinofermentans NRRL YB-2248]
MTEQTLIIPGDDINISEPTSHMTLGPNILHNIENNNLIPTTSGFLNVQTKKNNTIYYIESNTKRYIPNVNDFVIGTVVGTISENYRVSLNDFSTTVLLNQLAFPNATKKNRPFLKTGDLIYARVLRSDPDLEVELDCIDPTTGKEGGFGLLNGGLNFNVKLAFARYLLFNSNAEILNKLVSKCQFEIAIGVNGKIWLKTDDLKTTIACMTSIQQSQNWSKSEISNKVDAIFKSSGL